MGIYNFLASKHVETSRCFAEDLYFCIFLLLQIVEMQAVSLDVWIPKLPLSTLNTRIGPISNVLSDGIFAVIPKKEQKKRPQHGLSNK